MENIIENIATNMETQSMVNYTITVMLNRRSEAEARVEKLKKACVKFGVDLPTVTYSEPLTYTMNMFLDTYEYDVFKMTIDVASVFKLDNGYTLQAIVDNGTGAVKAIDIDSMEIPMDLLQPSQDCDHCGVKRFRTQSFILQNEQKELMRVGGSCIKKFLGINPQKFVSMLNYLNEFKTEMFSENEESFFVEREGSNNALLVKVEEAISALRTTILADGGEIIKAEYKEEDSYAYGRYGRYSTTKKVRSNTGQSTCEKAITLLESARFNNKPVAVDSEYASKVIAFIESLDATSSEFNEKAKKLTQREAMRQGEIYTLCGAISAYEKTANGQVSSWVGRPNDKEKITATVTDYKFGEGMYGAWYLWTLVDANGNVYNKFGVLSTAYRVEAGTKELGQGVNKGDVFKFTAVIKAHKEFRGIKTTELGRLSKF
jgi:hypothetical protein